MGIQGLLPFLKHPEENLSAIKPSHLNNFKGQRAAVDAYSWLHKGVYTCAQELFLDKPTTRYVDYCLKNVRLLLDHAIVPVLVFDGGRMPLKVVDQKRSADRAKAKQDANSLIAAGRMNEAYTQMVQSISITHAMASKLMKAARRLGVESVVAPYEADAQLVYLERQGVVDVIISEDSDLVVFGARRVFLKLTSSGSGELFDADGVELCLRANKHLKGGAFDAQKLLHAAILSGCDYLRNLPGIGLMKAWKFMSMTANTDVRQFLRKVPSYLKLDVVVDEAYVDGFVLAALAFQYQLVFDTRLRKRVTLQSLADDVRKEDYDCFLRQFATANEPADHLQLALGNVDWKHQQYDDYAPPAHSYLYGGVQTPKACPAAVCFRTEGVYKRRSPSNAPCKEQEVPIMQDDVDLADYYKNLNVNQRGAVASAEQNVPVQEPPAKRIRCKFFKHRATDAASTEQVRSRFFKRKDSDDIDDIPKENMQESEVEYELKDVFKAAGVEIDSESSNDAQEPPAKCSNEEEIVVTPDIAVANAQSKSESPIIRSNMDAIKPKLKEIQNAHKFKAKRRLVVGKNQPTLLGFFTKL